MIERETWDLLAGNDKYEEYLAAVMAMEKFRKAYWDMRRYNRSQMAMIQDISALKTQMNLAMTNMRYVYRHLDSIQIPEEKE